MDEAPTNPPTHVETSGDRQTDSVVFRGFDRWSNLFVALVLLLLAVGAVIPPEDLLEKLDPEEQKEMRETGYIFAAVFVVAAIIQVRKAIRLWQRPYVRVDEGVLVVRQSAGPQYLPRHLIASWRTRRWSTVLTMKDGERVRMWHSPFVNSAEAARFQVWLGSVGERTD